MENSVEPGMELVGLIDMAGGKAAVIGKGENRIRFVAKDDAAALIAAVALEPDPTTLIEFGGPEAISKNEAAEIATELTGRRMKVIHDTRPLARLAVRLLAQLNDGLPCVLGLVLQVDTGNVGWDDGPLRQRGIVSTGERLPPRTGAAQHRLPNDDPARSLSDGSDGPVLTAGLLGGHHEDHLAPLVFGRFPRSLPREAARVNPVDLEDGGVGLKAPQVSTAWIVSMRYLPFPGYVKSRTVITGPARTDRSQ